MLTLVKCENCGNASHEWNQFNYTLEAENPGCPETCNVCHQTKMKGKHQYTFWFCSRACLEEYLKTHQEKDYKHLYET